MSAVELLRQGKLQAAYESLQDQVRKNPSDAKLRVFLFQILAVQGQWDRALTQLNVSAELDAAALAMAQMYREALQCEVLRAEVFAGKRSPLVLGQPPDWIGPMLEALRLTADGNHAAAGPLRASALDSAPTTSGVIDGQRFAWLADADSRLGPVVEAIVNGRYYWVPVQNIRQIMVEKPADLRDLVWTPVHFTWVNEGEMVGLIPTRYPGSEHSSDEAVRMARRTDWSEVAPGVYLGAGQRMWATDVGDFALLETRQVDFGEGASPADTSAGTVA